MEDTIPAKERKRIRDKKIRALWRLGYTMDQIVEEFNKLDQPVSKPTVFWAIRGRSKAQKKKAHGKRIAKRGIINHLNKKQ